MAVVAKSYLLEAGVHFGHQTKRWNPKMRDYIFTARDDIYIIDLQKTVECLEEAYAELLRLCEGGGQVLFVGTKKQAQEVCIEEATRSKSFYITERWLGGTLTNFKTIRDRVKRMVEIEKMEEKNTFELLPKKEVAKIKKEYDKLNKILSGIRDMDRLPKAVILVDPRIEINAVREARRLHIPVFGIVDTNSDPDDVDFVLPANDDAVRSIKVVLGVLCNAVCEANGLPLDDYTSEEEFVKVKKTSSPVQVVEKVIEENPKKEIKEKEEIKKEEKTIKETKITEEKIKKEEKVDLKSLTVAELKNLAKEKGIKGISTMKKDDLISALK